MGKIIKFLVVGIFVTQLFAAHAFASPQEDGMLYLENAYRESARLKNFHSDIMLDIKTPIADLMGTVAVDFYQEEPICLKATANLTLIGMDGKEEKIVMRQYAQEQAGELLFYMNMGDKWIRSAIPFSKLAKDERADLAGFMAFVKSAAVNSQDAETVTVDVVVDMEKVSDFVLLDFDESHRGSKAVKSGAVETVLMDKKAMGEIMRKVMAQIGEVAYTVAIDKKSNHVVYLATDLTEPLRNGGFMVIEEMKLSAKEKANMKLFLQNCQVILQEDISQFDQVEPFVIPEDVVRNAVDQAVYRQDLKKAAMETTG